MAKQPVPEEEQEDIMVKFEISQQFHWAEIVYSLYITNLIEQFSYLFGNQSVEYTLNFH